MVDASYEELDARDFAPFRVLSDMPMAMTAHVIYTAVDRKRPATTSRKAVKLMRRDLGFGAVPVRLTLKSPKNPFSKS